MSIARTKRKIKRQRGQYMTPRPMAKALVDSMDLRREHKILEPSMGDGSFVLPIISRLMRFYRGSTDEKLSQVLRNNLFGVELDEDLYARCLCNIKKEWSTLPSHNLFHEDFFVADFSSNSTQASFDYVVGNPPFGGTINPAYQDELDKQLGYRGGLKIKKETYSFFIVKSMDLLRNGGNLFFICSDTFLTIPTMKGLRYFLLANGAVEVNSISHFSDEVSQKTVLLKCEKGAPANGVLVNGEMILTDDILATPNYSWAVDRTMVKYFHGAKVGDFLTATSGMTVGKNEYFIRDIKNEEILEPYRFSFYKKLVTLEDAVSRARLGRITPARRNAIFQQQSNGETVRDVRIQKRSKALRIKIPHPDYCYYNKARKGIVYTKPAHVIFWHNDGDAVYTYKRNGNWYLNGVGGKNFFFREGITWNLIASRLYLRYLPTGYVLDSGAPCAFLKPGIDHDEIFFILAWGLSDLCNLILKKIINHTKNIQSKDFERLPYPFWISPPQKFAAIKVMKNLVKEAKSGRQFNFNDEEIYKLNDIFANAVFMDSPPILKSVGMRQTPLLNDNVSHERRK